MGLGIGVGLCLCLVGFGCRCGLGHEVCLICEFVRMHACTQGSLYREAHA